MRPSQISGILAVCKPQGWGSTHVVAKIRSVLGAAARAELGKRVKVKVGHGGTLDPLATGKLTPPRIL